MKIYCWRCKRIFQDSFITLYPKSMGAFVIGLEPICDECVEKIRKEPPKENKTRFENLKKLPEKIKDMI